jgi:hypothetical protein
VQLPLRPSRRRALSPDSIFQTRAQNPKPGILHAPGQILSNSFPSTKPMPSKREIHHGYRRGVPQATPRRYITSQSSQGDDSIGAPPPPSAQTRTIKQIVSRTVCLFAGPRGSPPQPSISRPFHIQSDAQRSWSVVTSDWTGRCGVGPCRWQKDDSSGPRTPPEPAQGSIPSKSNADSRHHKID